MRRPDPSLPTGGRIGLLGWIRQRLARHPQFWPAATLAALLLLDVDPVRRPRP